MAASAGAAAQLGISLIRAYTLPATLSAMQPISKVARKPLSDLAIGIILAIRTFARLFARAGAGRPARTPGRTGGPARNRDRGRAQRVYLPPDRHAR